jgi:hypothetical protein
LIKVLLPQPFSPARQCISPERIEKLTSVSARTPPKRLLIPRISMNSGALCWAACSELAEVEIMAACAAPTRAGATQKDY